MTTPLHFMTITELAPLLASKQLSPVEVTRALLERIDALDGRYHAYTTVLADSALAEARAAEQEILRGSYRGPLHGVPVAVKDLCFTKGVRTMGGCKVLADFVPDFDSTVVARLRAAGAVILGKLAMTEGAMGGYHPDFPIPKNPWNEGLWTGSSSSGSGVAVAAGLCFAALGSDTGGSIRFPAAACGVVGIKPTYGRVSRHGVLALAESMDHVGPLTRSVADAAIVLQAIAGPDGHDLTCLTDPVLDYASAVGRDIRGIRVGYDHRHPSDVDPEVAAAVDEAVKVLEGQGAEIVDVRLPDVDPYVAGWTILCAVESVLAHAATYPSRRDQYGPWFRDWLDIGASVSAVDYARANLLRIECDARMRAVMADVDVLLCPTMPVPAFPVTDAQLWGGVGEVAPGLQRYTVPSNYDGNPALPLPCGFTRDGVPIGAQLVGKALGEASLAQVGAAYQSKTGWHSRRAPLVE